jgi:rRNA-processing protein FCF1
VEKTDKMVRINKKIYEEINSLKNEFNLTISDVVRLIVLSALKLKNEKELNELLKKIKQIKIKTDKKILVYFYEYEYNLIEKIAEEYETKPSVFIRNLIIYGLNNIKTTKKRLKLFKDIDNSSRIDLKLTLNINLYNKIKSLIDKTNLEVNDLIIELFQNCSEEEILEKIKLNKKEKIFFSFN